MIHALPRALPPAGIPDALSDPCPRQPETRGDPGVRQVFVVAHLQEFAITVCQRDGGGFTHPPPMTGAATLPACRWIATIRTVHFACLRVSYLRNDASGTSALQ